MYHMGVSYNGDIPKLVKNGKHHWNGWFVCSPIPPYVTVYCCMYVRNNTMCHNMFSTEKNTVDNGLLWGREQVGVFTEVSIVMTVAPVLMH